MTQQGSQEWRDERAGKVTVPITCIECKRIYAVDMTEQQHSDWTGGKSYVQSIFPEKSEDERELLISCVCGPCFDALFADDE